MGATPSPALAALARLALEAGEVVMRHYNEGAEARKKSDNSPVTAADEEAEKLILAGLAKLAPGVPVVAEEEVSAGRVPEGLNYGHFYLVDPVDGTKEFVNRNGEFTVNIAEMIIGRPARGIVYAPAKQRLFMGEAGNGAFELSGSTDVARARPIRARKAASDGLVAVASRSHNAYGTEDFLAKFTVKDFVAAGSSLKFCLLAAGEADIYPRLGPTSEWDVAAGHAVLEAAGGSVTMLDGAPLIYGKTAEKFLNPHFVARGLAG